MMRGVFVSFAILFLTFQMFGPISNTAYAVTEIKTSFPARLTTDQSFNSPSWPAYDANSDSSLQIDGKDFTATSDNYNYFAVDLTPSATGTYEIVVSEAHLEPKADGWGYIVDGQQVDAEDDTAMFLYSSFDPNFPLVNLIAGNDDIVNTFAFVEPYSAGKNFRSKLKVPLTENETYTLVVTSYQSGVTGTLNFDVVGPGSVAISKNEHSTGYDPQDSTLNPTTATFDKYDQAADFKDVTTTITLNGNTLNDITLNGASIGAANYSYNDTIQEVTIKKEYLATLAPGAQVFTFDMSAGTDPTLTVTISDTTPVSAGGLTVTASDVTGAGTDGQTKISVTEPVGTGNKFVYKNFAGTPVTVPNVGDTLSGYSDLPEKGIIVAENGDKIAVAEVDVNGKVVRFGQTTAVVAAEPIEITYFDAIANINAGTAGNALNVSDIMKMLPTTVTANGNAVVVPVTTWVDTDGYNPNMPGSYTFTAIMGAIPAGYANNGNHTATIEVVVAKPGLPDAPASPHNLTAVAGDRQVTLNWSTVTEATYYDVFMSTTKGQFSNISIATVTETTYHVQGLTNGTTYYFIVKAGNAGGLSSESNQASATPATVPAAPTNVSAIAGNGQATVSFTAPIDDGGSVITGYEVIDSLGNVVATGLSSPITVEGLTNGTSYTFMVRAKNIMGSSNPSQPSNAVTPSAPSSREDDYSGAPAQPPTPSTSEPTATAVEVLVNGKVEHAGKATTNIRDNQTVTTITVDQTKLEDKLAAEGLGAVVTIPVSANSDVVIGELNGQMVKNMEDKQAVLEIKTTQATYTIPAVQINIGSVSDQIGKSVALQDIKVQIEIAAPAADTVKVVENAAAKGTFTIVAPPLEFTVRVTYGDTVIEVSKFNAYVERTIAIPDGTDPNRITTGVAVEPDGTVRHVPTKVIQIDGKYYAIINSLTNSTYTVVWHPLEFDDVANHWAKDAVNDMGSRMVIEGVGNGLFDPDRDMTRAEFAAIIVRALGLQPGNGGSVFPDVKETDWYSSAVRTAYAYDLVGGFEDGTFRPNDTITREQAMVILSKAMAITGLKTKLSVHSADAALRPYTDAADVSDWARSGIADCLQSGIVSGRSDTQLAPKDFITRAEVAAMVERLLQNSGLI